MSKITVPNTTPKVIFIKIKITKKNFPCYFFYSIPPAFTYIGNNTCARGA